MRAMYSQGAYFMNMHPLESAEPISTSAPLCGLSLESAEPIRTSAPLCGFPLEIADPISVSAPLCGLLLPDCRPLPKFPFCGLSPPACRPLPKFPFCGLPPPACRPLPKFPFCGLPPPDCRLLPKFPSSRTALTNHSRSAAGTLSSLSIYSHPITCTQNAFSSPFHLPRPASRSFPVSEAGSYCPS